MKKLILLLIISLSVLADEFPKTNVRYVLTQSGTLNIRETPVDGKVLTKLNSGEKVTVLGEAESDFKWKKVKTSNNITGYALDEFLGHFPAEEIQKGKLIGIVGTGEGGANTSNSSLRVLGGNFAGKWIGNDESGNFIYFMNFLVQNKKSLVLFENSKKLGSFTPKGITKLGCQEFKAIQGTTSNKISDDKSYFGTYGIQASKIDYALTQKIPSDISTNLFKEAVQTFKKNKISEKQTSSISSRELSQLKAGNGKTYLVARYAIKKDYAELFSVSIVAELQKNNGLKLLHNKFEELGEERGSYGGSFHLKGLIDIDDSGVPAILFHHNGFDSVIYELFQISDDKIDSLFLGGGDAC